MISPHATLAQLTGPGPLNYFFAFPAQQITNTGIVHSYAALRKGELRTIKEEWLNTNSSPLSPSVYFDDCQFLPWPGWEHQSIFMIDFGVQLWLEPGMRPGPGVWSVFIPTLSRPRQRWGNRSGEKSLSPPRLLGIKIQWRSQIDLKLDHDRGKEVLVWWL